MSERLVTFPTWHQDTLRTSDDIPTTIATIPIPVNTVVGVEAFVVGRCPYGDTALFARAATAYQELSGSAVAVGTPTTLFLMADDPTWSVEWDVSGLNILIKVTGDPYLETFWVARWATHVLEEV